MTRRGGWPALVVAGTAACVALTGCVSLPTAGQVQGASRLPSSPAPDQGDVILTPIPPRLQFQPREIVNGFLTAAGATWTGSPSSLRVAREYLTATYARSWQPSPAATVIDTAPKLRPIEIPSHVTGAAASYTVAVTSQHLETLVSANATEAGSIQYSSRPKPYVFDFHVVQSKGGWRIAGITGPGVHANTILLLKKYDFLRDYQARNLYFPATSAPHTLVPFPVYIPDLGGPLGVQQLAEALKSLPPRESDWLYGSVTTAFPRGTKLKTQVPPHGSQAIVELGGAAAKAGPAALARMEAQLVWTLTSSPYSAGSAISSVDLEVGGKSILLVPAKFASWMPQARRPSLYFQVLNEAGQPQLDSVPKADLGKAGGSPARDYLTEVPSGGLGQGELTAIAVSPRPYGNPSAAPTFAGCRGKTVYLKPLRGTGLITEQLPATCTSLSWDNNGDLWVTAGSKVFRIKDTNQVDVTNKIDLKSRVIVNLVTIPSRALADVRPGPGHRRVEDTFSALQVAPDGVRVAMIARGKSSGAKVVVTSISQSGRGKLVYLADSPQVGTVGASLADPVKLSWWDSDHLVVLDKQGGKSLLYEVPLNGGEPTRIPTPANVVSIAANGSSVAFGVAGPSGSPEVKVARGLDGAWYSLTGAISPAYAR